MISLFDEAWLALNQAGRLLDRDAFDKLPEPAPPPHGLAERLRDALAQAPIDPRGEAFSGLLDVVLEDVCSLGGWAKGTSIGSSYAETLLDGTMLKPRRVYEDGGRTALAVFVSAATRIGLHKGRRDTTHVVEYLRKKKAPLGLITNGREWRLIYADTDNTAFVEWTSDRFLEGDTLSPELQVLRRVIAPEALALDDAGSSRLVAAIRQARLGQARLSKELGERVRGAVELLLSARRPVIEPHWNADESKAVYDAACHFVMRLVVVFFAEARELLPVDSPVYHHGYGLKGLLESLQRAGKGRREVRHQAWPRLLALFRLLHRGSPHPSLVVPTYGGDLFRPGDGSASAQERALARIEDVQEPPSDELIYQLVTRLTRTNERVKEGNGWRTVAVPVDFTELTSEYIGILYEGLLDYELHRAGAQPVVFLGIGEQPALPLDRLEAMSDKQLQGLVEKAKVKRGVADEDAAEDEDDAADDEGSADDEADDAEPETALEEPVDLDDARGEAMRRALAWAEHAAMAAKLVRPPRGKKGMADAAYRAEVDKAAKQLISRVILPGELYVVRWGGTRKGAGTFYTRPQLTLPTVRRTLEPLVRDQAGVFRTPEEILSLKVCDPAMGSGSFLVASLRVLTEAVIASLHQHQRLIAKNGSDLVRIECALLPDADKDQGTDGVAAIVRRAVVEHCLYGVDLDPLAVELARVSLWVETLDKRLPFTFLDHKLRCGDALTGTWIDRFRDYPLLAWWRQSPDEKWRGVTHEGDLWADQLKTLRVKVVEDQRAILQGQLKSSAVATSDDELKDSFEKVRALYRELRKVPATQPDKRAEIWRTRVQDAPELRRVKRAFDTWCALWFWPLDKLAAAPRPPDFLNPSDEAQSIVRQVAATKRFFHWELEFPDVFTEKGAGFDAIVANPPWEIRKPSSKEFFSDRDPLYRSYGKQDALRWQREEFQRDSAFERRWLDYNGLFKDAGNFVRHAAEPFGNAEDSEVALVPRKAKESEGLHKKWNAERSKKSGLSDPEHPFRHQGSADLNSYKLFVEQAHALLKTGGQLGLITPSGLYTDKGSVELRRLLLDCCTWRWLYGFENRKKVFDIDSRFKFAVTIAQKGGKTQALHAAFMRHDLDDWAGAKSALAYPAERVHTFSPKSLAILEIRSELDLEVLSRLRAESELLGGEPGALSLVNYKREFHATDDSKLIPPIDAWLERGFVGNDYLSFQNAAGDVALPVLSGRIIDQFDFAASSWVAGKGRGSVWKPTTPGRNDFRPEFLMDRTRYFSSEKQFGYPKMALMEVVSATNERTCIGALVPRWPGIHKTPFMSRDGVSGTAALAAVFNSFCFDYVARLSTGGLSLGWFVLEALPIPKKLGSTPHLGAFALRLNCNHVAMADYWEPAFQQRHVPWRALWAVTPATRLRLRCIVDAIVAALYGLSRDDLRWILRDCDRPREWLSNRDNARMLDPKGFWRVDKDRDPELRHTVLTLVAFDALDQLITEHAGDRDAAISAFSALNDGEGWMIPEVLRLKDHGLGYDARADAMQPVASRLGPRFLDWQLSQSPQESWIECEKHARAILGDAAFDARFGKGPEPKVTIVEGRVNVSPKLSGTVTVKPATAQLGFSFDAPTNGVSAGTAASESLHMTISNIRLKNFRNWTGEHWDNGVTLKPITLVLGRNSAGKTSILQPLRLLKQTVEATDLGTHLLLDGTKVDGVNLGAFADVVHDHDVKESVGIGVTLFEKGISVDVTFRQVNERPVIESLIYRLRADEVGVARTPNAYQLQSPSFRLPNWDGDKGVQQPKKAYEPGRAIELSDQSLTDLGPTLGPVIRNAIVAVKEAFASFHYLGPLRPPPSREVAWSQQDPTRLGSTGSETIQALIGSETGKQKGELIAKVSEWLKRLDLADGIEIARESKLLYRIDVLRGGKRSNLADVGYGVSQVLPVIVLLFFVPEGSVILCEDPEAHLHPLAQSGLAELFVEVAKQRNLQLLLETHSEHLFRRLQYLIAADAVSAEDCALYFVERDDPSATLITLTANEFGQISNWPDHFFGDAMGETERQVKKIIERKRAPKDRRRG